MADRPNTDPIAEIVEWIIAAISGLAVLALMGFFLWEAVTATDGRPMLAATVTAGYDMPPGRAVIVEVANTGQVAAVSVIVEAEMGSGEAAQTRFATLDSVPAGSRRTVTLVFPNPAAEADPVTARIVGFSDP